VRFRRFGSKDALIQKKSRYCWSPRLLIFDVSNSRVILVSHLSRLASVDLSLQRNNDMLCVLSTWLSKDCTSGTRGQGICSPVLVESSSIIQSSSLALVFLALLDCVTVYIFAVSVVTMSLSKST
jgi:hypothetical protein